MIQHQGTNPRILNRYCVICGKKIVIKVHPYKKYQGGHFFGKIELDNKKKAEYWECNHCYYDQQ